MFSVEDEIGRKLAGSAPPPLLRHLLVPEPQQKGKRRAPSDAGGTGGTHFCWAD